MGRKRNQRNRKVELEDNRDPARYYYPDDPIIVKLKGIANWSSWLLNIEALLSLRDLYQHVSPKTSVPQEPTATWKAEAHLARALIIANIEPSQQALVPGLHDMQCREILDTYKSIYASSYYDRQREAAKAKFYSLERRPHESFKRYMDRFDVQNVKCWQMGVNIDDEARRRVMFQGLPMEVRLAVDLTASKEPTLHWRTLADNLISMEELDELRRSRAS